MKSERAPKPRQSWAMLHTRWVLALLMGGLVLAAAKILEPSLGPFNERAAAIALAGVLGIGYVVAVLRKMAGR